MTSKQMKANIKKIMTAQRKETEILISRAINGGAIDYSAEHPGDFKSARIVAAAVLLEMAARTRGDGKEAQNIMLFL